MPTFAEELNDKKCSCGVEEGCLWFSDGNGDEVIKVGDYTIEQRNNGVVVDHYEDEKYIVCGYEGGGKPYLAVFDPDAPVGKKWCDVPWQALFGCVRS